MRRLLYGIMLGFCAVTLSMGQALALDPKTSLTGDLTVDNGFTAYLDTSDAWASWGSGIPLGSGTNWQSTYSISQLLDRGTQYYLHVVASDWGTVAGFKGKFYLGDSYFEFANGEQTIVTDDVPAWWQVYGPDGTQLVLTEASYSGSNWMNQHDATIGTDAKWIWTNGGYDINTMRYFSTPITPVPEPISATLFLLGAGAFVLRRRRASK